MKPATILQKIRYKFDNTMSKGPIAQIQWLGLLSVILVIAVSTVVIVAGFAPSEGSNNIGFAEVAWMSMMRTLDAGTMGGDQGSWPFLFSMFAVTIGGVFIVSTFIGVLTSGIEQKIESLRKGRSRVVETDHTVILGFSSQIFTIIPELVEANANRKKGACIAILADEDKIVMEDEIKSFITNIRNTRIVCRTGNPSSITDLEIIGIHEARSIIILPPKVANPDIQVIKSILAITNNPNRLQNPFHIVSSLKDNRNLQLAKMVGKDEIELVLANEWISRIIVQTCRQSGLSVVHTELLDFGGDEIYYKEEPSLVGKTFGDILPLYDDSSVIGIFTSDQQVRLNPSMGTVLQSGDKIIAISQDDDTIVLSKKNDFGINQESFQTRKEVAPKPERALILGWNPTASTMIAELDNYVASGSEIMVVANAQVVEDDLREISKILTKQKVKFLSADITDRGVLDALSVSSYDHIIVLSCSSELDPQEADTKTLITLLNLRDISEKQGVKLSIVSEMMDVHNRELAEVTTADDFVVSERLVSLMLSQLSENKQLAPLFADLFDSDGSEIYLKPVEEFVNIGCEVNFHTVLASARRFGEIAIGYRLIAKSGIASEQYGVVTNPNKSKRLTFAKGDKIVVMAES